MELEIFLKNKLYNKQPIAHYLYPELNEKIGYSKFSKKLKQENYNKFSSEEKEKIITYLKKEFRKIEDVK